MRRKICLLATVLELGLLTGCLEYQKQTMSYRYDERTDTLRIFQKYAGIFAEGGKDGKLTAEERDQFESVITGQRTFFFNNWIMEYDRKQIEEQLQKLKEDEKNAANEMTEAGRASLEKLLRLLLDNTQVINGPCYLDADGKLCGVQFVSVTRFSTLVAAANDFASHYIKSEAEDKNCKGADKAAALRFAARPRSVVDLNGNSVTVRLPVSRESYEKDFGASATDSAKLAELRNAGLSFSFADDIATFKLGKQDETITRLTLGFSTNRYSANLVELAQTRHKIHKVLNVKQLEEDFLLRNRKAE